MFVSKWKKKILVLPVSRKILIGCLFANLYRKRSKGNGRCIPFVSLLFFLGNWIFPRKTLLLWEKTAIFITRNDQKTFLIIDIQTETGKVFTKNFPFTTLKKYLISQLFFFSFLNVNRCFDEPLMNVIKWKFSLHYIVVKRRVLVNLNFLNQNTI